MFKTPDLCLAATLKSLKFPVMEIDTSDYKFQFCFEETQALESLRTQYDRDQILVSPKEYDNSKRELQRRIGNEKRHQNFSSISDYEEA